MTQITELPRDMLYEIGSYLGMRDLYSLSLVSKFFSGVCSDVRIKPLDNESNLLPYQQEYIKWILTNERKGPHRGIITLTMGSGKTLTILTAIQLSRHKSGGLTLIIVEPSLLPVWTGEIQKFYSIKDPLNYLIYHRNYDTSIDFSSVDPSTVILSTPQTLRARLPMNENKQLDLGLLSTNFHRIIIDEVHSFGHKTADTIKRLTTKNLWVVSATPFETNKKKEGEFNRNIVSLFDCSYNEDYLYNKGIPIETPEVRKVPLMVNIIDSYGLPRCDKYLDYFNMFEYRREEFAKRFEFIINYVNNLKNDKILIFTQVNINEAVKKLFNDNNISFLAFDASLSLQVRQYNYNLFKSDPSYQVLLCSFTVASNGLNLAEANHSIFIEAPSCFGEYNVPDKNKLIQAMGRIYRYGQKKPCYITIFDSNITGYSKLIETAFPQVQFV